MDKWISVKDRMPEVSGYVVCIAKRNPFSRFMPKCDNPCCVKAMVVLGVVGIAAAVAYVAS